MLPVLNDKTGFHYVKLSDIAWKGFNLDMSVRGENCICCDGDRFRDCDSTKPGILLEGIKNPGGRKYRCLDGKHRIEALLSYEQTNVITAKLLETIVQLWVIIYALLQKNGSNINKIYSSKTMYSVLAVNIMNLAIINISW